MRSFNDEIVARLTATLSAKKSLMASSLGEVPGGLIAKANWARDRTLLSMMASTSSVLKPALVPLCLSASVLYTRDAASFGGAAIVEGYCSNFVMLMPVMLLKGEGIRLVVSKDQNYKFVHLRMCPIQTWKRKELCQNCGRDHTCDSAINSNRSDD